MHQELLDEIRQLISSHVPGGSTHPVTLYEVCTNERTGRKYALFFGGTARYLDCEVVAYSRKWALATSSRQGPERRLFQGPSTLIEALRYAWGDYWQE